MDSANSEKNAEKDMKVKLVNIKTSVTTKNAPKDIQKCAETLLNMETADEIQIVPTSMKLKEFLQRWKNWRKK